MPIVFVHGVKTRPGPRWEQQGEVRKSLFQRFALRELVPDPSAVFYDEPLWGTLAASPAWDNASLPSGDLEKFGLGDEDDAETAPALVDAGFEPVAATRADRQLLERTRLAAAERRPATDRQALEELLDTLVAVAAEVPEQGLLPELAEFSARASGYARRNPSPDWLRDVSDDVELLNTFAEAVETETAPEAGRAESFGFAELRDRLLEATDRIGGLAGRLAGRGLTTVARGPAHRSAAIFLGDVLVYLDKRGDKTAPGPIVSLVAESLTKAAEAVDADSDPTMLVVAHSMGGNIVYDLLTHFCPDLEVDVLVTVGSQVAFFEELKQFRASLSGVPADPKSDRVPRPPKVKRWINVFDRNDVLGFMAGGVFADVEDYVYSTGEGALRAHGAYFSLPSFHDRLRERLAASP